MAESNLQQSMPNLNIRGIVDLDQLSDVLYSLMKYVGHQDQIIADMEMKLLSYVHQRTFGEKIDKIVNSLTQIESNIQEVQVAVTARVNDTKLANYTRYDKTLLLTHFLLQDIGW